MSSFFRLVVCLSLVALLQILEAVDHYEAQHANGEARIAQLYDVYIESQQELRAELEASNVDLQECIDWNNHLRAIVAHQQGYIMALHQLHG